jgi:hypothetical protein
MGGVFGSQGVEEPAVRLIAKPVKNEYEVRSLPAGVTAVVRSKISKDGNGGAFNLLASYIGVFQKPQNATSTKISMTAPVIRMPLNSQIEGTKVITSGFDSGEMSMSFVLPSAYKTVSSGSVRLSIYLKYLFLTV